MRLPLPPAYIPETYLNAINNLTFVEETRILKQLKNSQMKFAVVRRYTEYSTYFGLNLNMKIRTAEFTSGMLCNTPSTYR